jgi:hypothetical protein
MAGPGSAGKCEEESGRRGREGKGRGGKGREGKGRPPTGDIDARRGEENGDLVNDRFGLRKSSMSR